MDSSAEKISETVENPVKITCVYPGCEVRVKEHLYQRHLLFCRKLYTGKYVRCQFSGRHLIPCPEKELHEANCSNRDVFLKIQKALKNPKPKHVTSSSSNTLRLTNCSSQPPSTVPETEPEPDLTGENPESTAIEFGVDRFDDAEPSAIFGRAAVPQIAAGGFAVPKEPMTPLRIGKERQVVSQRVCELLRARRLSLCVSDSGMDEVASMDGRESVYSEDYFSARDHS